MLDFLALTQQCAPTIAPQTMAAIVNVESKYNPFAIGVVGGYLIHQPNNRDEAVATAKALAAKGWNFSLGIAQVNHQHLPKYHISYEDAFDPCKNLQVGSNILERCFYRASKNIPNQQTALKAAISCYYSGNFTRGFRQEVTGQPSYVQKVILSANDAAKAIPVVPAIQPDKNALQAGNNPVQLQPRRKEESARTASTLKNKSNSSENSIIVF